MSETIRRKLIEVALPLEAINRESAREKSIRHGHPSTLHLWWARRPLAAARAVLFAQLVDDPSARPEEFPTQAAQDAERKRLFELIERLVVWENASDERLLAAAHEEILRSTGGNPPPILDPFAGGGSIPLEAQRLGLEAHASDLNPVAVLINKALIEIPPRYAGRPPVFPGAAHSVEGVAGHWPRATGLAEDVRRYGGWMRDEAERRIGHLYPSATLPDGREAKVIAWIWARTVTCPNPACGIAMPLVRSFWLSKKKDRPTWAEPVVRGREVTFEIKTGPTGPRIEGTVGRTGATCVGCSTPVALSHIRRSGQREGLGSTLMAVVAEGERQRVYLLPSDVDRHAAAVDRPAHLPESALPTNPRDFKTPNYGMRNFVDLFTDRQLVALTTFSDLVGEARERALADQIAAGVPEAEAVGYADALALYLAFALSKMADRGSTICTWFVDRDSTRNTFARQAIPMTWDFAELNVLMRGTGSFEGAVGWTAESVQALGPRNSGTARQANAESTTLPSSAAVSTDPPYYDNIGYADLSDFFYVWLRRSIGRFYPDLTATVLTPKADELVATPYRFGGSKAKAEEHFERGFVQTFTRIREQHAPDIPLTIFYAFKQAESDSEGTASTGWETMLNGLLEAGLMVTATWPMRTELSNRMVGRDTNALASSVVLACRPRPEHAEATTRRGFLAALKDRLPGALRELQQGSIAPVDLAQAAIGPGMAVFTAYSKVVEADGSAMSVRTALALINQVLDETLSEQEGDFDADTRFCVKWFGQYEWSDAESGTADTLSRATNTSVDGLQRGGIFRAVAGKARLIAPAQLPSTWDPLLDDRTSVWEATLYLAKTLAEQGATATATLMTTVGQRVDLDACKELAYLLYNVCERRGWTQSALLFNGLGTSWSDLDAAARRTAASGPSPAQTTMTFDEE
jgi:putative DNA methylase